MFFTWDTFAFLFAPPVLAAFLLWRYPRYRRVRLRSPLLYVVVMGAIIWGALAFVAVMATARVVVGEVFIVLWFMIGWRLAWVVWTRTVGRFGQRWVRWARLRRHRGLSSPLGIRLIPPARAALTILIFVPAFLSTVATHRCKLRDGQDPYSVFTAPFERVRIPTGDDLTLDAWFVPEKGADRTAIICHGAGANKGNFIWFLGPFLHHGYNVVFFDFRAHGSSEGRVTTWGVNEYCDVLAVVDWLKRERPHAARQIIGLGSSQGTLALAQAAALDARIDAVVLDSPFVSPRALTHDHADCVPIVGPLVTDYLLAWMSLQARVNFFDFSAEDAVAELNGRPLLLIHGDQDIAMPRSHTERLQQAATGPCEVWYGPGPHSNIVTTAPEEYGERLRTFIDKYLPSAEPVGSAPTTIYFEPIAPSSMRPARREAERQDNCHFRTDHSGVCSPTKGIPGGSI